MTKPLRICIADDEFDMRDYLARMLPRLGHEVVGIAENGQQLVDDCRRLGPDLVITDVRMPELDGLSAVREIRLTQATPAIIISAHQDSDNSEITTASQTLFLTKPVNRKNLQEAIASVFGSGYPS
jgi:CheY-like chemotaxis protein